MLGSIRPQIIISRVHKVVSPPLLPGAKRKRQGLIWLFSILGFFLVLGIIWGIYLTTLIRQENRLRAECEQKKEPLTPGDLTRYYSPVPASENAALWLLDLWSEDGTDFADRFTLNGPLAGVPIEQLPAEIGNPFLWMQGEPIPDEQWTALTDYLQKREDKRTKLLAAIAHPQCRFPIIFSQGMASLLPHLPMLKLESDRLVFDVLVAAQSNQVDRAVTNLLAISTIARHLSQEPSTVGQLVSIAVYQKGMQATAHLLSNCTLSEADLTALAKAYSWYSSQALSSIIRSERTTSLSMYDSSAKNLEAVLAQSEAAEDRGKLVLGYRLMISFSRISGCKQADCIHLLNTYRQADTMTKSISPDGISQWEKIFHESAREYGFPPRWVSKLMLPAIGGVMRRHLDAEAVQQTTQAVLAVELFRLRTKKLPQSLAAIQTANPKLSLRDPFTDGPLHFKILEKGYQIYSLGVNKVDDDGKAIGSKGLRFPDGDLVFTVKR